jgi:hypothetical protein
MVDANGGDGVVGEHNARENNETGIMEGKDEGVDDGPKLA